MNDLDLKHAKLDAIFRSYEGEVAVAFSCYDENPFMLPYLKTIIGSRVFALEVDAEIFTKDDRLLCQSVVRGMGVELFTVPVRVMHELDFVVNDEKRCYFCRRFILGAVAKAARSVGARDVIIGMTADNLSEQLYVADVLDSLGVSAPLAEAGLTTADVDALALKVGIELPPGGRCMAERVPRDMPLDGDTMQFLGDAELLLRDYGFHGGRVEIVDDRKAKIVWPKTYTELDIDARDEIMAFMRARHFEIINLNEQQF